VSQKISRLRFSSQREEFKQMLTGAGAIGLLLVGFLILALLFESLVSNPGAELAPVKSKPRR
jgi:hypothetical protein